MKPTVLQQVAAIGRMSLGDLREKWKALMGTEPPPSYGSAQLVRRLTWRIQELAHGGLSEQAKQRLKEIAEADPLAGGRPRPPRRRRGSLAPGTRLIRHWHGVEHVVVAMAGGDLDWNGRRYRTLTAVAKAISGQHCSGPRFFGLVSTSKDVS
jgi:hypothetical protein